MDFLHGWLLLPRAWKLVIGVGLVAGIAFIIYAAASISNPSSGSSSRTDTRATRAATELEDRRKGFHCLSKWGGHHDGLEALVRDRLNDPGSMRTYKTLIAPANDIGEHLVAMDFGARNQLGGMERYTASAYVNNRTCEAALLGIE